MLTRAHFFGGYGFKKILQLKPCPQVCACLLDVGRLWIDAQETFPGVANSVLIDRFLDTVMTSLKLGCMTLSILLGVGSELRGCPLKIVKTS